MSGRIDLREERGQALVVFAVFLPFFVMFAALAIDTANLWVHKRHLQTQADAAVLAGASKLQITGCDNADIIATAKRYSGADPGDYNRQIGGAVNPVVYAPNVPCSETPKALEVTMTEQGVGWLFNLLGTADSDVRAIARAELEQAVQLEGVLPLAIKDQRVDRMTLLFVDESKAVGASGRYLDVVTLDDPLATTSTGEVWSNAVDPATFKPTASDIGVRVAIKHSGEVGCALTDYACLDRGAVDTGSTEGLLHIHAFATASAVTTGAAAPALQNVALTSADCSTSPLFHAGGCSLTVTARVDWLDAIDGDLAAAATDAAVDAIAGVNATVGALGTIPLRYRTADASLPYARWEGTVTVPAGGVAGPLDVTLGWVQKAGEVPDGGKERDCGPGPKSPKPCVGSWTGDAGAGTVSASSDTAKVPAGATPVHRSFVRSAERSGELQHAGLVTGGSSIERCTAITACVDAAVVVSVGVPGPLKVGDHRSLALPDTHSNDQLLDCFGSGTGPNGLETYLAQGCPKGLAISPDDECTAADVSGDVATCVPTLPSQPSNTVERGITRRVYFGGDSYKPSQAPDCSRHPNHYDPADHDAWTADFESPRIVPVVLARDPGEGKTELPVKDFVVFYITGWSGNPCAGSGGNETVAGNGYVNGYFIKYAVPNNGTSVGGAACDESALGACVAVMTK